MNKTQALNILALLHDDIDGLANGREYDSDSHIASLANIVKLQGYIQALPDNYLTISYTVGEHFLPALINDDLTGLDDNDENAYKSFLINTKDPDGYEFSHFSYDNDEFPEFDTCEITNLGCNCVTIKFVFKEL